MTKNDIIHTVVAGALVLLLIVIANPLHLWMPTMAHMTVLAIVTVVFGVFAAFVLREEANDEREDAHRSRAGHTAFLAGASVLILGILYESYIDTLDVWLVASLVAMVLAKVGARFYSDRHQ